MQWRYSQNLGRQLSLSALRWLLTNRMSTRSKYATCVRVNVSWMHDFPLRTWSSPGGRFSKLSVTYRARKMSMVINVSHQKSIRVPRLSVTQLTARMGQDWTTSKWAYSLWKFFHKFCFFHSVMFERKKTFCYLLSSRIRSNRFSLQYHSGTAPPSSQERLILVPRLNVIFLAIWAWKFPGDVLMFTLDQNYRQRALFAVMWYEVTFDRLARLTNPRPFYIFDFTLKIETFLVYSQPDVCSSNFG